jgi:subtilisin family serine protease
MAKAQANYIEGEVLVTFKAGASETQARGMLKNKALQFHRHFRQLSKQRGKQMGFIKNKGKTTAQLIAELKKDPTVEHVEPNYIRRPFSLPSDPRFNELWALRNTGQTVNGTAGTAGADINYVAAARRARTSTARPIVAVIDTGVDPTHPDLKDNLWINAQEIVGNEIDDDGNGYVDDSFGYDMANGRNDPVDAGSHGTHVAGTIAAVADNALGIAGVNENARIMALRVADTSGLISSSAFIDALEYTVAMKVRGEPVVAINASFGGPSDSLSELNAIQAASNVNILFIAAAGNNGENNDVVDVYPANYRLDNMIVVAASNQQDQLAGFSNFGAGRVDMAAPGTNILSVKPTVLTLRVAGVSYPSNELTFSGQTNMLTGNVIDCGIGGAGDFPPTVSGHIALIERGGLTFATKVTNAMSAGATAAIIYNNVPTNNFLGTLITPSTWVPSRSVSRVDGLAMKAALPTTGEVAVEQGFQFLNGTSMATPHVAAAVALAAICYPNENGSLRKVRVLTAVDQKPAFAGKTSTGGRLNLLKVIDPGLTGNQPWPYITGTEKFPGAALTASYSFTPSVSGGTAPYTFELKEGALPDGLSLSPSGLISGTPTATGTSTFSLLVSDANGPGATQSFQIVTVDTPLEIMTSSPLAGGDVGADYTASLSASGGTPGYTWSLASGLLPPGVELSAAGVLSGVPYSAGQLDFTVRATDVHLMSVTKLFSITIDPSSISITPSSLPPSVLNVAYQQQLTVSGGTPSYTWGVVQGALPQGITLSSSGLVAGVPTQSGVFTGTIRVTDGMNQLGALRFSLSVTPTYVPPQLEPAALGSVYVGVPYSYQLHAIHYPDTFRAVGLPRGLVCSSRTGIISGTTTAAGTYAVILTATNRAGTSLAQTALLTVRPIEAGRVGSFDGIVERNTTSNRDLGARLTLTTTAAGTFSLKLITGATTRRVSGSLRGSAPQIQAVVDGVTLSLTFDAVQQTFSGLHGTAAVTGWRQEWHASYRPALGRMGYYSAAFDPTAPPVGFPEGSGFATFNASLAGVVTTVGRTADGKTFTGSSLLGPTGQVAVHQSLYNHGGSLSGILSLSELANPADNRISGSVSWMKPMNGFSATMLTADGGYLAPRSGTGIILGLPAAGSATLSFTGGGVALSNTTPDVIWQYTADQKVQMPTFFSGQNPGRTSLVLNARTGVVSGGFKLVETSPPLTRQVTFTGQIVRRSSGATSLMAGYFLLPQIGAPSTVLSGKVSLTQP